MRCFSAIHWSAAYLAAVGVLRAQLLRLLLQLLNDVGVVLEFVGYVLMFLQQALHLSFVNAGVLRRNQSEGVEHPVVDVVGIGEQLVVAHGGVQPTLAERHQVEEVVPLRQDVTEAFLDPVSAEVSLGDELVADRRHAHQLRLVGQDVGLQRLVFRYQQVHGSEVVSDVINGDDLFLLLDPVLFIGHVPVELPQFAAVLQTLSALHGEVHELCVRVLELLYAVHGDGGVARPVRAALALQEALRLSDHHLDSFSEYVDVGFNQRMLL